MVFDRKPRGYWLFVVALGVAVFFFPVLGQSQEQAQSSQGQAATEQEPSQPSTPTPTLRDPIRVEIVQDQTETDARQRSEAESIQREKDDLLAQQGMNTGTQAINDATQRMAKYSLYQTWAVAVGTVLVFASLVLTVIATWAAHGAVRVTREVGRDQMRAYVHAEWAKVFSGRDSNQVIINVRNTGQTPALEVKIITQARLVKPEHDAINPPIFDTTSPGYNWGAIGNGGVLEVPAVYDGLQEMILDVELGEGRDQVQVYGTIRYKTMFNEIFDTMFCFHCNDVGPGVEHIGGRLVEKAAVMHRSPYILPAYRLYEGRLNKN